MTVTRQTFDQVMIPCYVPQDMVLERGEGCYLYDTEGKRYVDLSAGIAVNCLGHNHPAVVKTISEQAQRLIHVSNIFVNDKTLTFAQELTQLTGFDRVFFNNSGAEANEAALKLARRVAYDNYGEDKNEIISFAHSFHGRTLFSVSVGGQPKYSSGFGPAIGGITHLEFNNIKALEETISDKTCAVILEPIQGEGGILPIEPKFLERVRQLCDQYHALLIFDEVQTGVGRTGTFYAFEQFKDLNGGKGVRPDILSSAKGLAAGIPIGAILTTNEIAQHFKPGTHGSTFGGNPLACAVGSLVLHTVSNPEFLAHVSARGDLIRSKLSALNDKYHCFQEIRGKGLLIGAQMSPEYQDQAGKLQKLCSKHGLLVLVASANVLRLTPPLIITETEINEAMTLLEQAIQELTAQ